MATEELILELRSQFAGDYPEIPLPDDIERDDEDVFVTLPIGRVGATSRNLDRTTGKPREYSRRAMEKLVAEINQKRPEGGWGHQAPTERMKEYKPDWVRWLAAKMVGDTVWAKLSPLTEESRTYFRSKKRHNAQVGTSLQAVATLDGNRVVDLDLKRIDIGDPAWVGIPETAARPLLTNEMVNEESEDDDMSDELIQELRSERDGLRDQLTTLQTQLNEASASVQIVTELRELVGEGDVVALVSELRETVFNLRRETLKHTINTVIEEMVQLEDLRPVVAELVGEVDSEDAARERVEAILKAPHIEKLAQRLVSELAGPSAIVKGIQKAQKPTLDDTPEARAAAQARLGIG